MVTGLPLRQASTVQHQGLGDFDVERWLLDVRFLSVEFPPAFFV